VSGNDKLFTLDLATKQKKQVTFGTHDDTAPRYLDDHTLVFASTATDPNTPVDPEVARNGNIYNVWTLDLNNGELERYTDTVTGTMDPVVLHEGEGQRIAFVTYYKGDWGVHAVERKDPTLTVASSDYGSPGPIIDFQAPLQHTLIPDNMRKKGRFEKMFLEGRPPVALGVTSSGDLFGGTSVTFTDVLGDQQFNVFIASVSQYRTLSAAYVNMSRRLQFAAQGFSQTQFFFPGFVALDPAYSFLPRDLAIATRTVRGGSVFGIYPFNRYARLEMSGGVVQYNEKYDDPALQQISQDYQQQAYGTTSFRNGTMVPFGVALVRETTVFREFGPLAGNTFRIGYEISPKFGNTLSRQTVDVDARYYLRIGTSGLLALRGRGLKSWGDAPDFLIFGGNSELRGYDYLQFLGTRAFFTDAELRFPLIEAMATPIGVMGGIRGTFFFNLGAAGLNNQPFTLWRNTTQEYPTIVDYTPIFDEGGNFTGSFTPVYGDPKVVSGFRLVDARASYGVGLETFALGFPIHFDWSWRTLFNKDWEDVVFATSGGHSSFRKVKLAVWIGYDF